MVQALVLSAAVALTALGLPIAALAQMAQPHQPYAESHSRPIKALSEQQIANLRAGRGMGLALAAELNGYPGPSHVLEHADALGLSPAQRERTRALFEAMKAEAAALGERLIQQEADLDQLFATKTVQPASLDVATSAIGAMQGALRAVHLRYHLAMMEVLMPEQVRRYSVLRGYGAGQGRSDHGGGSSGGHGAHAR